MKSDATMKFEVYEIENDKENSGENSGKIVGKYKK